MMIYANRAINNIQRHIQSMMKVSSHYGNKMGAMGKVPAMSGPGANFARKTANMMHQNPTSMNPILSSIMSRAEGSGMSKSHMERMSELMGRVRGEMPGLLNNQGPNPLRWI